MTVVRRVWRPVAALCVVAVLAWGAGFAWFLGRVNDAPPHPPHADGIVVLTGGAERIASGLQLLAECRAPRLLVSGVGRGADVADMVRLSGVAPGPAADALSAAVTLGRAATSTWGNARETAAWAEPLHLRSLIVVTAGYHMPRALLELRRTMPGVVLYPAPVRPPAMRSRFHPATWRLLAGEYSKWLAVRLHLMGPLRRDKT